MNIISLNNNVRSQQKQDDKGELTWNKSHLWNLQTMLEATMWTFNLQNEDEQNGRVRYKL
jgi:hypothetical protein